MVQFILQRRMTQTKILEWLCSFQLIIWGLWLLYVSTFATVSALQIIFIPKDYVNLWAFTAITVGVLRATALYINGHWRKTPIIRGITSIISATIWGQIALNFVIQTDGCSNIIPIYLSLMLADFYAAAVSGYDAASNWRKQRDEYKLK